MRCLAGSSGALRFLCKRKGGQGAARGSVWFQWLQSCRAAVKVESLAQQTAEDVPDAGFDNGEAEKWDPLPAMKSSFRRDESHMPHAIFALCRQAYKGAQAGTFGT